MKLKWYEKVYALYKGDDFICEGTIPEIHEQTGKSMDYLRYMRSKAYERKCIKNGGKNRLALVLLDDDE